MIIGMYDPELADALEQFERLMPDLMAAAGMTGANDTLAGFMSSYLYGLILVVFPMVYSIIRANSLVAKYVDQGSMAALVAAPVRRTKIISTQLKVLVSGLILLIAYCTVLEFAVAQILFPDELMLSELLRLNSGLLCLQLFIACFCFLCSCIFSETKYSIALGAGIPSLMYVLQMLANMGGKLEKIKYFTFFTLFDPENLIASDEIAFAESLLLLLFAVIFFEIAVIIFNKKDLHI